MHRSNPSHLAALPAAFLLALGSAVPALAQSATPTPGAPAPILPDSPQSGIVLIGAGAVMVIAGYLWRRQRRARK